MGEVEVSQVKGWTDLLRRAAKHHDVPASLVASVMLIESGGDPWATSPMNYSGGQAIGQAKGLMQVMPWHFSGDQDPYDPELNVFTGTRILRQGYERWGTWEQACAAYFGAIDAEGNITGATDVTGTSGNRYVALAMSNQQLFADMNEPTGNDKVLAACVHLWAVANILEALVWKDLPADLADSVRNDVRQFKEAVGLP